MFCTNCGASNNDEANFCINCGESLGGVRRKGVHLPVWAIKGFSLFKKAEVLKGLFDLSFSQCIASKMIKFLYGLSVLSAGLMALSIIYIAVHTASVWGVIALLIGALLLFLLIVIASRVVLETIIAVSRLADRPSGPSENPESKDGIQWNIE